MENQNWNSFERDDLKNIPLAESLGWNRTFHHQDVINKRINPNNPPHFSVSFKQNVYHLWRGKFNWIIATNINGRFENHTTFNELTEALNTFQSNKSKFPLM